MSNELSSVERSSRMIDRIVAAMQSGEWRTIAGLVEIVGGKPDSVASFLRSLGTGRFGDHKLSSRQRSEESRVREYRLIVSPHGLPAPIKERVAQLKDDVMRRLAAGDNPVAIGAALGITDARVRQIRFAHGIRLRNRPLEERLAKWIVKTDSCWLWTGATDDNGYGKVRAYGKSRRVHRVVYKLLVKPDLRPDELLLHSCDTPPCCNPEHLRIGTQLENAHDRESRDRGRTRKLNAEQVAAIRDAQVGARGDVAKLARQFGINHTTVARIRSGRTWKWI